MTPKNERKQWIARGWRLRAVAYGLAAAVASSSGFIAPDGIAQAQVQMSEQYQAPTSAEELRVVMNLLLQEHTYLTGAATMAAAQNNSAELQAIQRELDQNTDQLSQLFGSVYGASTEQAFRELWRNHISYFVSYAQAASGKDRAAQQQATQNLDQYARNIGQLLGAANPNVTAESISGLFQSHVQRLDQVIDQTVANNPSEAFRTLQQAARASNDISNILATTVANQFPNRFPGEVGSDAANLRANMNRLVQEHVILSGLAASSLATGRNEIAQAATPFMNQNATHMTQLIGAVYGPQAEQRFGQLWTNHIGYYTTYAQAARANNTEQKTQASQNLDQFRRDLGALFDQASPTLTQSGVAELFEPHVRHVTASIDAAARNNSTEAWAALDEAVHQGRDIARPVSEAIIAQFPERFGASQGGAQVAPATATPVR